MIRSDGIIVSDLKKGVVALGNITLKEICVESRKSNYDYIEAHAE